MKWSKERKEAQSVKMKAYWEKKNLEVIDPVPVLAEPKTKVTSQEGEIASESTGGTGTDGGEVRESTETQLPQENDSRGGIKTPDFTITDIKFEGSKPGYYIYEREVVKKDGKDRECWYCGCAYESRLLLNKFCCPDHKERWLRASLRRGA